MRKAIVLILAVIICLSLFAGCSPDGSQPGKPTDKPAESGSTDPGTAEPTGGTIKIGTPASLTGMTSAMDQHALNGAALAVEDLNAAGGVLGKQIVTVSADLKSYATEDVVAAAEYLKKEGVVANFCGGLVGSAPIHAFGKYPWLFTHSAADSADIIAYQENRDTYTGIFQICDDETAYAPFIYDAILNKLPVDLPNKKVAVLGGDINYDMKIGQGFVDLAEADGWEVILNDTYAYNNTDFSAQLAVIRQEKPAIIFAQTTSNDSATAFMSQFWERPTESIIHVQWAPSSPEFIELLGDRANGVLWSTVVAMLPNERGQAFRDRYVAEFGMEPAAVASTVYDSIMIWSLAVEKVGDENDHLGITEYFENLNDYPYPGLNGNYGMDKDRHSGIARDDLLPVSLFQVQDEKDVLIFLGAEQQPGVGYQTPSWIK